MTKKKRPPRARTLMRVDARKRESLVSDREALRRLEPGGSREHPLDVSSASVVETRAASERCFRCDAPLRVEEHASERSASGLLRVVKLRCPQCGATRALYVRIVERLLN
ncbi:MAG: hypothetical protein ABW252_12380 [Polyangiales bacterium]